MDYVSIGILIVAVISLLWNIYTHFRVKKIVEQVFQIENKVIAIDKSKKSVGISVEGSSDVTLDGNIVDIN